MKKNIFSVVKIYMISILVFIILSVVYAAIIERNSNVNYIYPRIIIGGVSFFLLGFLSANFHQEKGILVSIMYSFISLVIIYLSIILIGLNIDFMTIFRYVIFMIFSVIGGILGVNVKKIV